jgi:hypothetical protein
LGEVVKTWRFVDEEPAPEGVDINWEEPSPRADMPAIRAMYLRGDWQWMTNRSINGPVQVKFTLWIPSARQRLLLNLWGAVRSALRPEDADRHKWVKDRLDLIGGLASVREQSGLEEIAARGAWRSALRGTAILQFNSRTTGGIV